MSALYVGHMTLGCAKVGLARPSLLELIAAQEGVLKKEGLQLLPRDATLAQCWD